MKTTLKVTLKFCSFTFQAKAQAPAAAETYNKLDDTSLLGDSLTSEPGDFKRTHEKQAVDAAGSDVTDTASKPLADGASRLSAESSESGGDVTRNASSPSLGSPSKSESDRDSPKKNRKSTSSNAEAKPEEKKKKVKTHRRVSSASGALMAIGKINRLKNKR